MPLDILVPFWGDPELLMKTLRSVQDQDADDWVLTVVDDAYPDESVGARVKALADDRIRYVRNDVNLGITDNYRRCLQLATQDRVTFLGCDDLLHPGYVRAVLAAHRAFPDVEVIQPGVEIVDENDALSHPLTDTVKRLLTPRANSPRVLGGEALAKSLLRGNWLYWPAMAFRRETLLGHDFLDGFPIIQDLALVLDIVFDGGRLLLLPDVVFSYRRHSASASSTTALDGSRFRGEEEYFKIAARKARALGWRGAERAARAHLTSRAYAITLLPQVVRAGRKANARALLGHALSPSRI
ncbi:glycosyltransferase family 2 protein [Georgenia sp. AZ-5]|uniref:glycosyltransferase family 2 protein n=1 Tax=Georgenia sp. AZ-5 TaxID=3367526 RepID=UPI003754A97D